MLGALLANLAASSGAHSASFYERRTGKAVADVLHDAEFAITDRNFRITGRLHIGTAIQERGYPDFPENEVILFCNVTYTHEMLQLDASYVNYCPAKVTVRDAGADVVVTATLFPTDSNNSRLRELMETLNRLLREIVDYAVREWSAAPASGTEPDRQ